jgi:outer membrane lipoprotein
MPYYQNVSVKQPRFMKLYAFVGVVCLPLLFTGCSPYHLIVTDDVKDQVNYELRFEDIVLLPENYKGELIVLGGEVLDIDQREGKTTLVVCHQRLSTNLTPKGRGCTPGGPFVIVWSDANLVDLFPPIRKGDTLTFVGEIRGSEAMQVKKHEIEGPLLALRSHFNWDLSHWETSSAWRNPG